MFRRIIPSLLCVLAIASCRPSGPRDTLRNQIERSPCDIAPPPQRTATQALTGGDTFENEIHDCQRLVESNAAGDSFGALVGIFPLDGVMDLPQNQFLDGRTVASIYSWGATQDTTRGYAPLQIRRGWQCLWLRWNRDSWSAAITPVVDVPCSDSTGHPLPEYDQLTVIALVHEDSEAANPSAGYYPPTARWGWDPTHKRHYISIRCATGWCVIGNAAGFEPRESSPLRGPKERSIPGWYDEQHLAVHDTTDPEPPVLRPGPWGTIYPAPNLATSSEADFAQGVDAADIVVVEDPAHPGGLDHYVNKFFLQKSNNTARGGLRLQFAGTNGSASYVKPGGAGTKQAKGFDRLPETLHSAPGAVRWKWRERDESSWVWCIGCCDAGEF